MSGLQTLTVIWLQIPYIYIYQIYQFCEETYYINKLNKQEF